MEGHGSAGGAPARVGMDQDRALHHRDVQFGARFRAHVEKIVPVTRTEPGRSFAPQRAGTLVLGHDEIGLPVGQDDVPLFAAAGVDQELGPGVEFDPGAVVQGEGAPLRRRELKSLSNLPDGPGGDPEQGTARAATAKAPTVNQPGSSRPYPAPTAAAVMPVSRGPPAPVDAA